MKNTKQIDDLSNELKKMIGCLSDDEFEKSRKDKRSLFFYNETWKPIQYPNEYIEGDTLHISCTQTNLNPKEQKKLVQDWCIALPKLQNINQVFFHSRVPQELFDSACEMYNLEKLYIKWSGITNIDKIQNLKNLKYLKIGTSPSIASIDPLIKLTNLSWLELENIKTLDTLNFVENLTQLKGFAFTGQEGKRHKFKSFNPLSNLTKLEWLHLGSVQTEDNSLKAFSNLQNLKYLGITNYFPLEEYAYLSTKLSSNICHWLAPFSKYHSSVSPCRKCKINYRVLTTGKGSSSLCPTCDSIKLAKHIIKFQEAVENCS